MAKANDQPDAAEIAAQSARFRRLYEMMNERIRNMTPQERDRNFQEFFAQPMAPSERLRALRGMLDMATAHCKRQQEARNTRRSDLDAAHTKAGLFQ